MPTSAVGTGRIRSTGRALGEDTDEVLAELAGLSAKELAGLRERGVIA